MDREKLKQYKAMLREQQQLEKKIDRLYAQIDKLPAVMDKVEASQKEFPYIRVHLPVQANPPEEYRRLDDRIREHEQRKEEIEELICEIETFIRLIPDSVDRQIFEMIFIDGMTQEEVGEKLNMDRSTISKRIARQLSHNSHF